VREQDDLVILAQSKQLISLVEKINLPIRYRRGGVVDKDAFLREKIFHAKNSDRNIP